MLQIVGIIWGLKSFPLECRTELSRLNLPNAPVAIIIFRTVPKFKQIFLSRPVHDVIRDRVVTKAEEAEVVGVAHSADTIQLSGAFSMRGAPITWNAFPRY